MKKTILLIAMILSALPVLDGEVYAQDYFQGPGLSFTNLEFGYEMRSFESEGLDDGNGLHAGFSIAPIPFLYFAGDFRYANAQAFLEDTDDVNFIDARVGMGGRISLADTLAFYVEVGAAYGQLGLEDGGYDGAGFYFEPGLKLSILGRIEGSVALEYASLESETIIGAKAGLLIGITDNFGITAEAGITEHSDFVGLGLRIAW